MLTLHTNGRYKTTTRSGRNSQQFSKVASLAGGHADIIEVGPGGTIAPLASISSWGRGSKHISIQSMQMLFRLFEGGLRKTGLFPLTTFETAEILNCFYDRNKPISRITVIDIEPKVLEAVVRSVGTIVNPICADIVSSKLNLQADVVFCNNVLQRITDFSIATYSVINMCNSGGILAIHAGKIQNDVHAILMKHCRTLDERLGIYEKY